MPVVRVEPRLQFQPAAVLPGQPPRHLLGDLPVPPQAPVLVLPVRENHPDDGPGGHVRGAGRQILHRLTVGSVPRQHPVEAGHGRAAGVDHRGAHGDPHTVREPPVQLLDLRPVQRAAHEHQVGVVLGPQPVQMQGLRTEARTPGDVVGDARPHQHVLHPAQGQDVPGGRLPVPEAEPPGQQNPARSLAVLCVHMP